jgi:hypothetical protein
MRNDFILCRDGFIVGDEADALLSFHITMDSTSLPGIDSQIGVDWAGVS